MILRPMTLTPTRSNLSETHRELLSEKHLIAICTFNERANLPELFERMRSVLPTADVLVIDDHSPDGTADWVREVQRGDPRVHLIERPGKLGLGTAIRDAMQFAIANDYHWLFNLDGDLSHDPAAIPSMLARAEVCDLAIGSRYVDGGGMAGCSWRRVWVSRAANWLARRLIGWKITDCSSAYRMYRVSKLKELDFGLILEKGYGFLEEVLAHLMRNGARVVEVPIVYTERIHGESKISVREAISAFSAMRRCARMVRKS